MPLAVAGALPNRRPAGMLSPRARPAEANYRDRAAAPSPRPGPAEAVPSRPKSRLPTGPLRDPYREAVGVVQGAGRAAISESVTPARGTR